MPELIAGESATAGEAAIEITTGEAAEVEPAVQGSTAEADKVSEAEPEASDVGAAGEQSNKESDSSDDSSSDDEVLSDASDSYKERLAVIRAEVLACEEEGGKNAEAAVPRTKNECTVLTRCFYTAAASSGLTQCVVMGSGRSAACPRQS
jgi:hypothetical protein